ncbi:hypothetical protein BDK51DRAFT_12119, partial [Blyttiomyces helicus]
LKLDTQEFTLFTQKPRNYSIVTILTALSPQHGCAPCRDFAGELELVAQAWARANVPHRLYISTLDYMDGREVFAKLQLTTVPYILYFPPTSGPHAPSVDASKTVPDYEQYDVNRRGLKAEQFATYLGNHVGHEIHVRRPIDWSKYGMTSLVVLAVLAIIKLFWRALLVTFQSRKLWETLVLGLSVLMCSGHMWNTIRNPPYNGMRDGRPELIAPGFQQQYILESQIAGLLYAGCAVVFIALVVKVPKISDPVAQRTATYICIGCFVMLYSALLRLFRFKNGAYPFKLV